MTSRTLCPLCEAGNLHVRSELTEVEYRDRKVMLDSYYAVCDACGAEQVTAEQARQNKRATMAFRKACDGLLTGAEVRSIRELLHITQGQAAQIFGGGPVAFSKYESDDVAQSSAMDKLLRVAVGVPDAFLHLMQQVGLEQHNCSQAWQSIAVEPQPDKRPVRPELRLVHSRTWANKDQRKYG